MLPIESCLIQRISSQSAFKPIVTTTTQTLIRTATLSQSGSNKATGEDKGKGKQKQSVKDQQPRGVSAIVLHTLSDSPSAQSIADSNKGNAVAAEAPVIQMSTQTTGTSGSLHSTVPPPAPDPTPADTAPPKRKATVAQHEDNDTGPGTASSATAVSKLVSIVEIIKRTYLAEAVAQAEKKIGEDKVARARTATQAEPASTVTPNEPVADENAASAPAKTGTRRSKNKDKGETKTVVGLHQYTYLGALESLSVDDTEECGSGFKQDKAERSAAPGKITTEAPAGTANPRKRTRSEANAVDDAAQVAAKHNVIARDWLGLGPSETALSVFDGTSEIGQGRAGKNKRPRMKHSPFLVIVLSTRPIHALARAPEYTYQPPTKVRVGGDSGSKSSVEQAQIREAGAAPSAPSTTGNTQPPQGQSKDEQEGATTTGLAPKKARSRKRTRGNKKKKTAAKEKEQQGLGEVTTSDGVKGPTKAVAEGAVAAAEGGASASGRDSAAANKEGDMHAMDTDD